MANTLRATALLAFLGASTGSHARAQGVAEWNVAARASAEFGNRAGAATVVSGTLRAAARLSSGGIVVLGGNELRLFSSSGEHLKTTGGKGEADGQFVASAGLAILPGDTVVVFDEQRGRPRLTFFTPSGQLQRVHPLLAYLTAIPQRARIDGRWYTASPPVAMLHSNGVLTVRHYTPRPGALVEGPGMYTRTTRLLVVDPRIQRVDSLGTYSYLEHIRTDRGEAFLAERPFGRRLLVAVGVQGQLFVATGERAEIAVFDRNGRQLSTIRMPEPPLLVSAGERRAALDTLRSRVRDPEQSWLAHSVPGTMPPYRSLIVDRTGMLWVERYRRPGDSQARWWVFDPHTGDHIANVQTPPRAVIHDIGGDYVLLSFSDEATNTVIVQLRTLMRH